MTSSDPIPRPAVPPGLAPLLTVEDVGRMLSIGPRGARKALERGVLPGFRWGRRWYCRPEDLDAYFASEVEAQRRKRADALRILAGLPSRRRTPLE